MSGFIQLHRKLMHWEWYENHNVTRLFIHCLLKANHKDDKWQGIIVKRGSFVTGINKLSTETGLSKQQLRTALEKLQSTQDISIKPTNKYSVVTIVNYGDYQGKDAVNNTQTTNKQQTNNNQITTNNNDNNINNGNNNITVDSSFDDDFESFWTEYKPYDMVKGSKKSAKQKYITKRKDGITHDTIITGTREYIAYCHNTGCRTKHAVSFLNQDGFHDEYTYTPATSRDNGNDSWVDEVNERARIIEGGGIN